MSDLQESEERAAPIANPEDPTAGQMSVSMMEETNGVKHPTEVSDDSKTLSEHPSTPQSQITNLSESTEISSKGSKAPPLSASASLAAAAGASQPIEQHTVRKPAGLPANASLADRIAALQKSSSIRRTDRSVSSSVGGSSMQNGSNIIGGIGENTSRSVSSGSKIGSTAAVKDRIAKFQTIEAKPLIPKSSFGSPVPMHNERNTNALKPYPGANASGSGSGSWGEGVLRPQATGGAWGPGAWQSGDSSFSGANANVRPQLTGSAWLGVGGSSPSFGRGKGNGSFSSAGSLSRSPINSKRDAFLDLDEDTSSSLLSVSSSPQKSKPHMRRDGSFSEAQLAAAQMGLGRTSRAASTDGNSESGGGHSMRATASEDSSNTKVAAELPSLPDAPTSEIKVDQSSREEEIPSLPDPPSSVPIIRSPQNADVSSNDVEIGVANMTPEKLANLRRRVSGTGDGSYADSFLTSPASETSFDLRGESDNSYSAPVGGAGATGDRASLMQAIQSRRKEKAASLAARSQTSTEEATSEIGRLALNSDDGSILDRSPSFKVQDLPSRANVQGTDSDRVDPNDPRAHKVMGAGLLVPDDEIVSAERQTTGKEDATDGQQTSIHATDGQQNREQSAPPIIAAQLSDTNGSSTKGYDDDYTLAPKSVQPSQNDTYSIQIVDSAKAHTTSTFMTKSNSEGFPDKQSATTNAANEAKQAITAARSKSQRVQRPPPGRMMTAAEMDASDDEYEPGWVSVTTVMSSSRQN